MFLFAAFVFHFFCFVLLLLVCVCVCVRYTFGANTAVSINVTFLEIFYVLHKIKISEFLVFFSRFSDFCFPFFLCFLFWVLNSTLPCVLFRSNVLRALRFVISCGPTEKIQKIQKKYKKWETSGCNVCHPWILFFYLKC